MCITYSMMKTITVMPHFIFLILLSSKWLLISTLSSVRQMQRVTRGQKVRLNKFTVEVFRSKILIKLLTKIIPQQQLELTSLVNFNIF